LSDFVFHKHQYGTGVPQNKLKNNSKAKTNKK